MIIPDTGEDYEKPKKPSQFETKSAADNLKIIKRVICWLKRSHTYRDVGPDLPRPMVGEKCQRCGKRWGE